MSYEIIDHMSARLKNDDKININRVLDIESNVRINNIHHKDTVKILKVLKVIFRKFQALFYDF